MGGKQADKIRRQFLTSRVKSNEIPEKELITLVLRASSRGGQRCRGESISTDR